MRSEDSLPQRVILDSCILWGPQDTAVIPDPANDFRDSLVQGRPGALDPRFVDPANGNLRLRADSPAINRGSAREFFHTDLDGNPGAVDEDRPDLGAYESQQLLTYDLLYGALYLPGDDENGDGLTNFENYAFGMDPAAPFNALLSPGLSDPNSFSVFSHGTSQGGSDVEYSYWTSSDLENWSREVDVLFAGEFFTTGFPTRRRYFYGIGDSSEARKFHQIRVRKLE